MTWLLFFMTSGLLAWNADPSLGLGPDQTSYMLRYQEIQKLNQGPNLFRDLHNYDVFPIVLGKVGELTGDVHSAHLLLLFVLSLAYLWSMYHLLFYLTKSPWAAVLVAVASVTQRFCFGTTSWGFGEYQLIVSRLAVLPLFPLILLMFLKYHRTTKALLAFVLCGVSSLIHLSSVYLYIALMAAYGLAHLRSMTWRIVAEGVLASLFLVWVVQFHRHQTIALLDIGPIAGMAVWTGLLVLGIALPTLYALRGNLWVLGLTCVLIVMCLNTDMAQSGAQGGSHGGSHSSSLAYQVFKEIGLQEDDLKEAVYSRFGWTLFPISLATLGFVLFNMFPALLGGLAPMVARARKGFTREDWILFQVGIGTLIVSFGLTGVLQWYSERYLNYYLNFELFRASKILYLVLYCFMGFLFAKWLARGQAVKAGVVTLLMLIPPMGILWGIPDSAKMALRETALETGLLNKDDYSQRTYLERILKTQAEYEQDQQEYQDFLKLSEWASQSTSEEAIFLMDEYRFILRSGRRVTNSYQQGAGSTHSKQHEIGMLGWYQVYNEMRAAYRKNDLEALLEVGRRYATDYVVATKGVATPSHARPIYSNSSFDVYPVRPSITQSQAAPNP